MKVLSTAHGLLPFALRRAQHERFDSAQEIVHLFTRSLSSSSPVPAALAQAGQALSKRHFR